MDRARTLLRESEIPIAAVASECGFPDNNYFSRLFHQKEQMTPREYRLLNRKKPG